LIAGPPHRRYRSCPCPRQCRRDLPPMPGRARSRLRRRLAATRTAPPPAP